MESFIKWAGSKRQIRKILLALAPYSFNNYYEPFLGGGSFFWALASKGRINKAYLSDINPELICGWQAVQKYPKRLLQILTKYQAKNNNSKSIITTYTKKHKKRTKNNFYLKIRALDRQPNFKKLGTLLRGARMIYLNKSCFNGIWRVNSHGYFDVPWNHNNYKGKLKIIGKHLKEDSHYLSHNPNVKIQIKNFTDIHPKANDFVYFDSPYIPLKAGSDFTTYTKNGFKDDQQKKLVRFAVKLTKQHVKVMLSNSGSPRVKKLYHDDVIKKYHKNIFKIHNIKASRVINSNGKKRGKVKEVVITNY